MTRYCVCVASLHKRQTDATWKPDRGACTYNASINPVIPSTRQSAACARNNEGKLQKQNSVAVSILIWVSGLQNLGRSAREWEGGPPLPPNTHPLQLLPDPLLQSHQPTPIMQVPGGNRALPLCPCLVVKKPCPLTILLPQRKALSSSHQHCLPS